MSRILRSGVAAALVAAAFATTTPASADPLPCKVYLEGRMFSLFGATWYGTFPVQDCV